MNSLENLPDKRRRKPEAVCCVAKDLAEEPKTLKSALNSAHSEVWIKAAEREFQSLTKMKTWQLVPRESRMNVVGNKWVFKVKRNSDTISRFKARLVTQGFSQERGVDYDEVLSPDVKHKTIRVILAIATELDLSVHQLDVKTAFLNGDLEDEIFKKQPEGFVDEAHREWVCRLLRSLYGLKQASRCWNLKLDEFLKLTGFTQLNADSCVYIPCVYIYDSLIKEKYIICWE